MKAWTFFLQGVAVLTACSTALAAEEGRFDAQVFRPLAAPRDLVMVPKSEVIGHLSPVVGVSLLPDGPQVLPVGSSVLSACKKEGSSSGGCSVLTQEGVLKKDSVLGKPSTILPSDPSLPGGNILPKGGSNLPRK